MLFFFLRNITSGANMTLYTKGENPEFDVKYFL